VVVYMATPFYFCFMINKIKFLFLIIAASAILISYFIYSGEIALGTAHWETSKDYKVEVRSVSAALEKFRISKKYIGKVRVIHFWETNCGPCLREIPQLNQLVKKSYLDKVCFIALSAQDSASSNRVLKRHKLEFLFDQYYEISGLRIALKQLYYQRPVDQDALPLTLVIDSADNIVYLKEGALNRVAIDSLVQLLNQL
jgi:thiol-disulfide isomerase/thioredoxin